MAHVQLNNILEPTGNDVLSGRGVTTNRHPGNVSYRSLVALNKASCIEKLRVAPCSAAVSRVACEGQHHMER
jgi:hypothetical protein